MGLNQHEHRKHRHGVAEEHDLDDGVLGGGQFDENVHAGEERDRQAREHEHAHGVVDRRFRHKIVMQDKDVVLMAKPNKNVRA